MSAEAIRTVRAMTGIVEDAYKAGTPTILKIPRRKADIVVVTWDPLKMATPLKPHILEGEYELRGLIRTTSGDTLTSVKAVVEDQKWLFGASMDATELTKLSKSLLGMNAPVFEGSPHKLSYSDVVEIFDLDDEEPTAYTRYPTRNPVAFVEDLVNDAVDFFSGRWF